MSETSDHEHGDANVLVFEAAGERFALPLNSIVEIVRPGAITRVPHSPPELLGVANFRGTVAPVVSANVLLGKERSATSAASRIIMIRRKSMVGLLVDKVATASRSSDVSLLDVDALLAANFQLHAPRDRQFVARGTSPAQAEDEAQNELVFVSFTIARQEFALGIDRIAGVTLLPSAIARLPRTDQAMLGAAEVDGALVPLVSLHFLLGFPPSELDQKTSRVILVQLGEALVGVVVDGVREIVRIAPDALDPVPPVLTRAKGEAQIEAICRLGRGRRLISILNPAKLFDSETVDRVLAAAERGSTPMKSGEEKLAVGEQFVVFQLSDEYYGLPIEAVDEVVRCPENLTRVPVAPPFVKGLMNLRGKAVPVIDQRQRFAVETSSQNGSYRRVIVVTVDGLKAGFLVDKVSEVLTVPADELEPAPELATQTGNAIDRVAMIEREGHMILLVDPKALLDRAEREFLESITNVSEAAPNQ
ncbi:chemotaxis protein CheW [Hyphomicrobium sp.]|uniref:chemotaxis protein CheW n=1 Tax=Hyphomicrobium sp. TaxID=82 RepID=UPI002D77B800|nr:chemotaxis protein CheW [Hyphomicrobium sp.]HET6388545.1 chemotaxis protein CheW [Hyphomicrobium sp.]